MAAETGRREPLPDLSVVIPAYNEAGNVEALLGEVGAALKACRSRGGALAYEVIVVDDASDDGTLERLCRLCARMPRLRVLHHHDRSGQSAAMITGVRAARAEWIATLDGDGQNDPADIPKLLSVLHGADAPQRLRMVCGWRRRRHDSWLRRLSSRIANAVRSRLLHDDTPDTGCGLKLISREAFLALPAFDHMHRFLPSLVQRAGDVVLSVEVNHRPRVHGKSKYGVHNRLWVGIVDLFGVMWLRRRYRHVTSDEVAGSATVEDEVHRG